MTNTIAPDVGRMIKPGLGVYDRGGRKVGFVDYAGEAHGWMQVESSELDLHKVWVPYRLVKSVDDREVIVTVSNLELHSEYGEPPARTVKVEKRDGRTFAVTTEPSGYDGEPVVVNEVELGKTRELLALGQQVWTSDDVEVGKIKEFDATMGYVLVEHGALARKRDLLIPVHLVADVDRDNAQAKLAVRDADLKRMRRLEHVDVVIDMPAYLAY